MIDVLTGKMLADRAAELLLAGKRVNQAGLLILARHYTQQSEALAKRVPFSLPNSTVERVCDTAAKSFRAFKSSARGQQVTQASSYEWHLINATLDEVRAMLSDRPAPVEQRGAG